MPAIKKSRIVRPHASAIELLKARHRKGEHIAPGFKASKASNMTNHGGKTLPDLRFTNIYLGHWDADDIKRIDAALAGALTDPGLNNVIQQYFTPPITTEFLGSTQRGDSSLTPGSTFDRDKVHSTLASLDLSGLDLSNTVICLLLPRGVILDTRAKGGVGDDKHGKKDKIGDEDDKDSSLDGLGGYHGSAHINGRAVYFAAAVYSDSTGGTINGIPFWPDSWKNVVATLYHELTEARTDPDVEEAIRTNDDSKLGWYSDSANGEIGDIPMNEAGENLGLVMVEVALQAGGTAPVQLMWSNNVGGPGTPFSKA